MASASRFQGGQLNGELQPGILVRYEETTSRWFVAVVRLVNQNHVELEYLSGDRQTVPAQKLTPFILYLKSRESVLSLKRDDLCYVLYGRALSRLRQDRIEEMQKFLRSHGLRFSPGEWSSDSRVQIRHDDSFIESSASAADREFDAPLPRWLEPHRLPPGSRDPLGFQSHAEKIADEFLPGLTVFTTRIGYYGLITWAVRVLNNSTATRGIVRRESFHPDVVHFFDADGLAGRDLAEIDFLLAQTDSPASGDHDSFIVEGIVDVRQAGVGARGRLVDFRGTLHVQSLVRTLLVEDLDEVIELGLQLKKV